MRFLGVMLFALSCITFSGPSAVAAGLELPDHPLSLDDCVALGLQRNPSLAIAREGLYAADANLRRTRSSYYPSATFVVTQGRVGGSSFVETPAGTIAFSTSGRRRESEVLLREVVWETGRHQSARQSKHALAASRSDEQAARQGLVWSVSQQYYHALAAEDLVEVAQAALAASKDHEKLVRARTEVGEAAPVDLFPAEADSAAAELTLIQAQNDADIAKALLKSTMGVPPTYRLRLARPAPGDSEHPALPFGDALSLSLAHRPELASLRQSIAGGESGVAAAEATKNAVVSLSAQYQRGLTGPQEGENWSVVAYLNTFLFDGGLRRANVDTARSRLRSLKAREQDLINAISLEVETALLDVETARKSLEAAKKSVASAEAQLAAAEGKYREGVGIFVEVLDAQETATRARTNLVRAMYDYQTALLAVRKALGTLDAGPDAGGIS